MGSTWVEEETGTDFPNQWKILWVICPEIIHHHQTHPLYFYVRSIKISRKKLTSSAIPLYSSTNMIGSLFLFSFGFFCLNVFRSASQSVAITWLSIHSCAYSPSDLTSRHSIELEW